MARALGRRRLGLGWFPQVTAVVYAWQPVGAGPLPGCVAVAVAVQAAPPGWAVTAG